MAKPIQARFLRRLAITIGSAYVLMIATDIRLLIAAWAVVSLGLHGLLTTYPDRAEAWRPARKKFLISRLGDVALIAAAVLIRSGWGTYDIHAFVRAVAAGPITPSVSAVALLIVAAALTKSAQFPFHSWLPETMEAPTPVSALMHAGIINAGGALLIRFAPAIVRVPESLLLLSVVGTITAALGTVAMWAQVKVKRTLAWSTVAQMGFMTVQCGLGAFPAALLHILGHGSYKAWSFLRSGGLPAPAPRVRPNTPAITLLLTAIGAVVGASSMTYASRLTGFHPDHSPGELALAAVVALSIGQAWAALIGQARAAIRSTLARFAAAIAVSVVGPVALFRPLSRGRCLPRRSHRADRPDRMDLGDHPRDGIRRSDDRSYLPPLDLADRDGTRLPRPRPPRLLLRRDRRPRRRPDFRAYLHERGPTCVDEIAILDGTTTEPLDAVVGRLARLVPPTWDLTSFVAVNPFLGFTDRPIADAARAIGDGVGGRVVPAIDVHRANWRHDAFGPGDLDRVADRHGLDADDLPRDPRRRGRRPPPSLPRRDNLRATVRHPPRGPTARGT